MLDYVVLVFLPRLEALAKQIGWIFRDSPNGLWPPPTSFKKKYCELSRKYEKLAVKSPKFPLFVNVVVVTVAIIVIVDQPFVTTLKYLKKGQTGKLDINKVKVIWYQFIVFLSNSWSTALIKDQNILLVSCLMGFYISSQRFWWAGNPIWMSISTGSGQGVKYKIRNAIKHIQTNPFCVGDESSFS